MNESKRLNFEGDRQANKRPIQNKPSPTTLPPPLPRDLGVGGVLQPALTLRGGFGGGGMAEDKGKKGKWALNRREIRSILRWSFSSTQKGDLLSKGGIEFN